MLKQNEDVNKQISERLSAMEKKIEENYNSTQIAVKDLIKKVIEKTDNENKTLLTTLEKNQTSIKEQFDEQMKLIKAILAMK